MSDGGVGQSVESPKGQPPEGEGETPRQVDSEKLPLDWTAFLESQPPEPSPRLVRGAITVYGPTSSPGLAGEGGNYNFNATAPEINLYCDADACQGKRVFEGHQGARFYPVPWQGFVLQYRCRKPKVNLKCFLVLLSPLKLPGQICNAIKLGEWPPHGEQMPKRALRLIEPDRQLFLQGPQVGRPHRSPRSREGTPEAEAWDGGPEGTGTTREVRRVVGRRGGRTVTAVVPRLSELDGAL